MLPLGSEYAGGSVTNLVIECSIIIEVDFLLTSYGVVAAGGGTVFKLGREKRKADVALLPPLPLPLCPHSLLLLLVTLTLTENYGTILSPNANVSIHFGT